MAENSLGKKTYLPETRLNHLSIDEILDDVLEEIPEMDTISRPQRWQFFIFPLLAFLVIITLPLTLSFITFRSTNPPLDRDLPYQSLERFILGLTVEDLNSKRKEIIVKDQTIRRLQQQLGKIDETLGLVHQLVDESLDARKQALKAETEAILGDERIRLTALGRSDTEIEQALARLETRLKADFEKQMDAFESQEMSLYQDRIETMKSERKTLETALNTAVEERKALAKTLKASEEALAEESALGNHQKTISESMIAKELDKHRTRRDEESYWLNELANQYLSLLTALEVRDYQSADNHLKALKSLFDDERISALPGYAPRNKADRELVRFLESYVAAHQESGQDQLLTELLMLVEQTEEHLESGRLQEASIGWERVQALWPLLRKVIDGSRATRETIIARDIRRYASLAGLSLDTGDLDSADLVWEAGLDEIPDPIGNEILDWWRKRLDEEARLLASRDRELRNIVVDYEAEITSGEEKRRLLESEITALQAALDDGKKAALADQETPEPLPVSVEPQIVVRYEPDPETERLLAEAENKIEALETKVAELEQTLASAAEERKPDPENSSSIWRPYGVVSQIQGNTLIIENIAGTIPSPGKELRIMRSLGEDRVIHLADGLILEANATRAVGSLSAAASGAEVYGSPQVNDLVYITN